MTAEARPRAVAVETSENAKLGPVSATYVGQASCPKGCPLLGNGCYAENGPLGAITRRLNDDGDPLALAREEAAAIDRLTGDRLLRLHVVGDCRTNRAADIVGKACSRYSRRCTQPGGAKKVWGYTHAWFSVRRESWGQGVSMLASCERPEQAVAAMRWGYAAALIVPSFKQAAAYAEGGVMVLPCPWQTRGVTCRDCGLCRDDDRLRGAGLVIGFEAHGSRANVVRRSLEVVGEL